MDNPIDGLDAASKQADSQTLRNERDGSLSSRGEQPSPVASDSTDDQRDKLPFPCQFMQIETVYGSLSSLVSEEKGGWFRCATPLDMRVEYSSQPLKRPLRKGIPSCESKQALKCFRKLRKVTEPCSSHDCPPHSEMRAQAAGKIIGLAMNGSEALRDEVYLQVAKQLTRCPTQEIELNAWEMLSALSNFVKPGKDLLGMCTKALEQIVLHHIHPPELPLFSGRDTDGLPEFTHTQDHIMLLQSCTLLRLYRLSENDLVIKAPSENDVAEALLNPYRRISFGISISHMYKAGLKSRIPSQLADVPVPIVVSFLTEGVLQLGGTRVHGICRVPGLDDEVERLMARIDRGHYTLDGITDAATVSSLLSRWLTQLPESIFPEYLYEQCISAPEQIDPRAAIRAAIDALPLENRAVLRAIVRLIRTLGQPQNVTHTQMPTTSLAITFTPNILRTPRGRAITPEEAIQVTNREKRFVTEVVSEMDDCPIIVPRIPSMTGSTK